MSFRGILCPGSVDVSTRFTRGPPFATKLTKQDIAVVRKAASGHRLVREPIFGGPSGRKRPLRQLRSSDHQVGSPLTVSPVARANASRPVRFWRRSSQKTPSLVFTETAAEHVPDSRGIQRDDGVSCWLGCKNLVVSPTGGET